MAKTGWWRRNWFWAAAGLACFALGAVDQSLMAQGCAMCKTSIAAQADTVVRSLALGIVVLLLPPVVIVSAILVYAFRRGG